MKQVSYRDEIVSFDSQLILMDLTNLASQVIIISDDLLDLYSMAEKMNNVFIKAGQSSQFEAIIEIESVPVYRWQVDGLE